VTSFSRLGRLLAAIPQEWQLFFELLARTGLRISEALGLRWSDVKFGDQPRLEVRRQVCRGVERALKTKNARRDIPRSRPRWRGACGAYGAARKPAGRCSP
jgi:integrase